MAQMGYYRYWGKTDRTLSDVTAPGGHHLLIYHCLDVAACCKVLLLRWHLLRQRLAQVTGWTEQQVLDWVPFLAALHDIGKFDPAFQHKVPALAQALQAPGTGQTGKGLYHTTVGYLIWLFLRNAIRRNWPVTADPYVSIDDALNIIMLPVTGHHGEPPQPEGLKAQDYISLPGEECLLPVDLEVSRDILAWTDAALTLFHPAPLHLGTGSEDRLRLASHLIAGLAITADWLGSDETAFKLKGLPAPGDTLEAYWDQALKAAEDHVKAEEVCPPAIAPIDAQHLFPLKTLHPMQRQACRIPLGAGPHLFIAEDQTGGGKTEAALMLASRIMAAGQADGTYLGLPTQATSNAMRDRLVTGTDPPCQRLYSTAPWVSLQHSKSGKYNLHKGFRGKRKARMLAAFGIGTIDQAVLGCLTVKHSTLRVLGLCTKTLIIDELHCYDEYTFHLIKTLVYLQASLGGSVIILSATLPRWIRTEISQAFQWGAGLPRTVLTQDAYPLLTHISPAGVAEIPVRKASQRTVPIRMTDSEPEIWQGLEARHRKGQACCWIRNTVKGGQEAYDEACRRFGPQNVLLIHARYAPFDRRALEEALDKQYGKKSDATSRKGRILIATQVVEQSLDLDFDFLAVDICPMDILLQRIGRFHRHRRDRDGNPLRDKDGNPLPRKKGQYRMRSEVRILAPKYDPNPQDGWLAKAMAPTGHVYRDSHAHIWATCRELSIRKCIRLPGDCRALINAVYGQAARLAPKNFPPGLAKRILTGNSVRENKDAFAGTNVIEPDLGYCTSRRWQEDDDMTRYLTRDITATVRLRLARLDATGKAVPLRGIDGWEDSDVPCYEQQAASWATIIGDEHDPKVVARLMAPHLPRKEVLAIMAAHLEEHKYQDKGPVAPMVVMYPTAQGTWQGRAFCLVQSHGQSQPAVRDLGYSPERGLYEC